jgi:hypothetical protein
MAWPKTSGWSKSLTRSRQASMAGGNSLFMAFQVDERQPVIVYFWH